MLFVSMAAWLQVYFLGAISGGYIAINLVVIIVVAIAGMRSLKLAIAAAIMGGFWLEVASVTDFGARIIFLILLVLGIQVFKRLGLLLEHRGLFVIVCLISALLYSIWLLIWAWFGLGEISWPPEFSGVLVAESTIVIAISFITFGQLRRLVAGRQYG